MFETEEEAIAWTYRNILILVPPISKKAKYQMVSPFSSQNAYEEVCKHLGKKLYDRSKNKPK